MYASLLSVEIPESVQLVLDSLVQAYPVEELILFGSRAVGDHEPRSDFDIAVRASEIDRYQFSKIRVEISEARTLYWVSLVHFNTTPPKLQARIQEQGVTIYDQSKAARQFV